MQVNVERRICTDCHETYYDFDHDRRNTCDFCGASANHSTNGGVVAIYAAFLNRRTGEVAFVKA